MPTAEAALRYRIMSALRHSYPRRSGVLVFGRPASAATGPGHPDLFGVVRGLFMALEIKTRTGRPTPLQVQRIRELRECGAYAWIVRSPEEALLAVRWILEGGRAPMSEEPIDLSAWLNNAPEPAETETEKGAAAALASVTPEDTAAAGAQLEAAKGGQDVDDLLADFPNALATPTANGTGAPEPLPEATSMDEPASPLTQEELPDFDAPPRQSREEMLQAMDARDDALNAIGTQEHRDTAARTLGHESAESRSLAEVRGDVRAVGERVTLVFEAVNRLETDLAAVVKMFRALLKELDVDDLDLPEIPPADAKRKRTRKADKE